MRNRNQFMATPPPQSQPVREAVYGSLDEAFRRYRPLVIAVARRKLRDKSLVEDVVQQVFFDLWRHPPAKTGTDDIGAWLRVVARNRAVSLNRRLIQHVDGVDLDTAFAAKTESLSEDLLAPLAPEQREALVLRSIGGLGIGEIAKLTNAPRGTVRTRLQRARLALRRHSASGAH
ncbi:MAG: RNA polymerase sigma factor [Terriglobales bacterium]